MTSQYEGMQKIFDSTLPHSCDDSSPLPDTSPTTKFTVSKRESSERVEEKEW